MNDQLNDFVTGPLKEHAQLVQAGVPSGQASNIIFSNEESQAQHRQQNELSECCMSAVGYSGLHTYCTECGESCHVVCR